MLNEVLNAGCNRAFGPGRREWTGRGGPFMWCTFSFGWSEGEAAAGTEEGRGTFSRRSGVGRSLSDHLWSGFSTCGRALDTWGLTVFLRAATVGHGFPVAVVVFPVGPAWRNDIAGIRRKLSAQVLQEDLLQAALLPRLPWLPRLQRGPPVSR